MPVHRYAAAGLLLLACSTNAPAQRVDESAVRKATDAFGTTVGRENLGLYNLNDVRGFSPIDANNVRIDGLYFDQALAPSSHLLTGNTIRVGISAQGYMFPSPTGIVDYSLRTAGSKPITSLVTYVGEPHDYSAELDMQRRLSNRLGIVMGANVSRDSVNFGPLTTTIDAAIMPTLELSDTSSITAFYAFAKVRDRAVSPLYSPDGPHLPPTVDFKHFYGQDWVRAQSDGSNLGLIGRWATGPVAAKVAVFRSRIEESGFADLFTKIDEDGIGDHRLVGIHDQKTLATSGEARLELRPSTEWPMRFYASLRALNRERDFGGAAQIALGRDPVLDPPQEARQRFAFGPLTSERVKQWTAALGADGEPVKWLHLNLGLQRASLRKSVARPSVDPVETATTQWLYNASATAILSDRLRAYGSIMRGLEGAAIAPPNATNIGSAPPAFLTEQVDAGIRYDLTASLRLVAGVFRIEKPYYALDSASLYRQLGTVSNRGIELSLTGQITPALRIVAGTVLLNPRVSGEEVERGLINARPIGSIRRRSILSARYDPPFLKNLSAQIFAVELGSRLMNREGTLFIPGRVVADFSMRYRFNIGAAASSLQLYVGNVFDKFGWRGTTSGLFGVNDPRRVRLTLSSDL